ncbi:amidohydrolase family protein, partial [Stenotrophomonas maltophilia]|uniref:amidohydrolase family protein n=1 Tax=Stenotrophomonas maltophilia TaxID=40324 RepID=UPI0013DBE660
TDPDIVADLLPEEKEERPWTLGEDHFHWFTAMAEMGMAPMAQILAATRNVAVAYGKADQIGTVAAGRYADMLVLDADPLLDIANIS